MTRDRFEQPADRIEQADAVAQDDRDELDIKHTHDLEIQQYDSGAVTNCRDCGTGLTPLDIAANGGTPLCGDCRTTMGPVIPP